MAELTLAANNWGPQSLRDSESAPAGYQRKLQHKTKVRPQCGEIPLALGGHDIVGPLQHLARPWQCRCCHKTALKRAKLACSRCPGSAVSRWDRAARVAPQSAQQCVLEQSCGAGNAVPMLVCAPASWLHLALVGRVAFRCTRGSVCCLDCTLVRECP